VHIFHGVRTYSKRCGCTKNIRWSIFAISATISIRKTVRYYGIQNISSHIVRTELGVDDDEYFTVISCVPNSKYLARVIYLARESERERERERARVREKAKESARE